MCATDLAAVAAVVGRPELHVVGRERRGWIGHDGTNCSICPKGTYKDVLGNSSCELAPLGQRQGRVHGGLPMVSLPGAVRCAHEHAAVTEKAAGGQGCTRTRRG